MKLSAVSQMLLNLKKENCQNQKILKKQRRQLRSKTRQFGDLQQRLEFVERELQYEQDSHQEQVAQLNDWLKNKGKRVVLDSPFQIPTSPFLVAKL